MPMSFGDFSQASKFERSDYEGLRAWRGANMPMTVERGLIEDIEVGKWR
jgi:hypothetical protein